VPQQDGHGVAVEDHGRHPHRPEPQQPRQQRPGPHGEADLHDGQHDEAHGRRGVVGHALAGDADHAQRVRAHVREQCERGPAGQGQAPGPAHPAVAPPQAELLGEEVDDEEVGVGHGLGTAGQADGVDGDGRQRQAHGGRQAEAAVGGQRHRHERGDHHVHRQEPHRHHHQRGEAADQAGVDAGDPQRGGHGRPPAEQHERGRQQAAQAGPQPVGVRGAARPRRRPRRRPGVAADGEEQRHDLEEP
jgi:hypothetical protein